MMSAPAPRTPKRGKNTGICNDFLNGNCRRGKGCKYKHQGRGGDTPGPSTPSTPSSPAGNRGNHGGRGGRAGPSSRGESSHSGPRISELNVRPPRPAQKQDGWGRYADWDDRFRGMKKNALQMRYFWEEALDIIEGNDANLIQKIVGRLVAKDNIGRQLVEQVVNHEHSGPRVDDYLVASVPLLLLLTHPEVINSIAIDRQVGTIYNYLYGTDGKRCVKFFGNIAVQLNKEKEIGSRESGVWKSEHLGKTANFSKALSSVVEGLRHTLKRNAHAGFDEDFKTVAEAYCLLAAHISRNDEFYNSIGSSLTEIIGIHRRANLIIELPKVSSSTQDKGKKPAESLFPMEADFPGYLSSKGPRHDNDHVSILDISILPTLEEILSQRKEYLPFKDVTKPHFLAGVDRLFDTHFRLLRHDCISILKNSLGTVFDFLQLAPNGRAAEVKKSTRRSIDGYVYDDVTIPFANFDRRQGLELVLRFQQPSSIARKNANEQRKWWDIQKSRFDRGTLACLATKGPGDFHRATFVTISRKETGSAKNGLSTGPYGNICVQLVNPTQEGDDTDLDFVLGRLSKYAIPMTSILIEFPGIIPATFVPVLQNLQQLSVRGTLPMSHWIAPTPEGLFPGSAPSTENLPPAYARGPEFRWDIKPILIDQTKDLFLSSTTQADDPRALSSLAKMTTLDSGQCKALLTGLTKEMSLIQGPPGTGKSYVGVQIVMVLLHNKVQTKIGPIICVCYTNHALDQFLVELLEKGVQKIVRVGGQSKSEELQGLNLQTVSKAADKTRSEKSSIYQLNKELTSVSEDAEALCDELSRRPDSWASVSPILLREFPRLHGQLSSNQVDPYVQAQEQEWNEKIQEELEEKRMNGDEGISVDPNMNNPWVEVSKPKEIWDAWRGVRRSPFWEYRNRNIINRPGQPLTLDEIVQTENVWTLSRAERAILVGYLSKRAAESPARRLSNLAQGHSVHSKELQAQYHEVDRRCLEEADVIGVTTTGLARQVALLSRVNSKVVVCEEAGEVLEAHLINAILPTCQHVIQIGDHQQLRPQINSFDLSLESRGGKVYSLDESMFERLVNEKTEMAPAKLNIQRRMRPEISNLIRQTLYPYLQDHSQVTDYPNVIGMRKNVYWLDHTHPEAGSDDHSASHSNAWEVEMTHSLVRHLVRQSHYSPKDIAVLTPYMGQLKNLRSKLQKSFEVALSDMDQEALIRQGLEEGDEPETEMEKDPRNITVKRTNLLESIRVATVDNFQGEEAKVVIISLVRSNKERKVGFLKTTNRINVLLSRAKHGMYIIGNTETSKSIPMWREVCEMLKDNGSLGPQLELICQRHPETPIHVEEPGDFLRLSPEGGCDLPCDKRLEHCGHRCFSKCHSDGMHRAVSCAQPCNRLHEACQHPCKRLCSEDCGPCKTTVHNFELQKCGHFEEKIECWRTLDPLKIICKKIVPRLMPRCGHVVNVPCHVDVKSGAYRCPMDCTHVFPCGHNCTGRCGSCNTMVDRKYITDHGSCKKICGRGFTSCNHRCRSVCHDGSPCGLCDSQCNVKCEHSKCAMKCQESCVPCAEPCAWKCKHQGGCRMPCAAPCELLPCDERCDQILQCGHRCPSLCGEICPAIEFCQICCSTERKEDPGADVLGFSPYGSIDLNENPILVLSCGHFFTRETLDGYLELHTAYNVDNQGRYVGYKDPEGSLDEQTPKCPSCRQPLLQYSVRRYGRVINRAAIMEMTRKYLASASSKYGDLSKAVTGLERDLVKSRDKFHVTLSSPVAQNTQTKKAAELKKRLNIVLELAGRLTFFVGNTGTQRQPIVRLHQSTVARKTMFTAHDIQASVSSATLYFRPDTRIELLSKILYCRTNLIIVTENALLAHHLRSQAETSNISEVFLDSISQDALKKAKSTLTSCRKLIESAKDENLPGAQVDAIGIFAKLVAIWRQLPQDNDNAAKLAESVKEATTYLDEADSVCGGEFTGVKDAREAIKMVRRQLNGGTFYQDIGAQEMEAVIRAMKAGFMANHSTGRWYYCQNGHPFTVGECGRPMQEMKCPECNAPVGGTNHNPASGVRSADALNAIARGV